MTDRRVFIQFRASTTIGIASEILRLALVRAALFSETVVPVRVGWLFWRTRSKYPHCIYDAIAAPRIAKGLGLSFRWMQLKALLAQAIDAARIRHAIFRKLAPPTVPLGQEGLYFHNAEMYRRLLAGNLHPAALRKVAHAVRDFGPVSLQRKCAAICAAGLERLGIGSDEWYVCLHVRTSAFHGDKADYRNARFQNYQKVIEHIIALGGKVIRLGDRGADIVTCPQPGLIDYPNTPAKSELMDLYLIKHCRFYIGTTSGILDTAYLFQTPTLSTNATNFDFRSSNKKDRVLFKRVFDRRNSEVLHFKEAIHFYDEIMSPSWSERFDYVENTSEELLDATVEFIDSLSNKKTVTRRQVVARRSLIRKRLSLARKNSEEYSMLSASLAFSRCQIIDSHLK